MSQQGQLIQLKRKGRDGEPLWAYRCRVGGRGSRRVHRGGFVSERDAAQALERDLERLGRELRISRSLTLSELVDAYLVQHDVEPVTIEKLRWLLGKAVAAFGERPVGELRSEEIAAWRIALSPGYRFDATQALRQVLARAVVRGMIDANPAKLGWTTPRRDVGSNVRSSPGRRSTRSPRISPPVFPAQRGGYLDLHNFRNREWKPAQLASGIEPLRRVYDLRHTFATFALRAGISTFDLARYTGASLTRIDRHYGHLARDGREHAIRLLDELSAGERPRWTLVDAAWTPNPAAAAGVDKRNHQLSTRKLEAL